MKTVLRRAYLSPVVRVVAFLVLLVVALAAWDAVSGIDWRAFKPPAVILPGGVDEHLRISPTRRMIAGCTDSGRLAFVPVRLDAGEADVRSPRFAALPPNALCAPFVWSPDGIRVAMPYVVGTTDKSADTLLLIPASGGAIRSIPLPTGVDPAVPPGWSPDGTRLTYVAGRRTRSLGGLWILDLAHKAMRRLRLGVIASPVFSRDGGQVLFEEDTALPPGAQFDSQMGDWPHIWSVARIPASGGRVERFARWTQGSLMPNGVALVAPIDGGVRYVRFFRDKEHSRVQVWDATGVGRTTRRMQIDLAPGHLIHDLAWSGDASRFAYIDGLGGSGPSTLELATVDTASTRAVAPRMPSPDLAAHAGRYLGPVWSDPDPDPRGQWLTGTVAASSLASDPGASGDEDESPSPSIDPGSTRGIVCPAP